MADNRKSKPTATVSVQPAEITPLPGTDQPKSYFANQKTSSTDPEKVDSASFGAAIERTSSNLPSPPRPILKAKPSSATMKSSKSVKTIDAPPSPNSVASFDEKPINNPFSAFYSHPPCSFERSKITVNAYAHDIEACPINISPKISVEQTKDCAMWPSQEELKRRRKADKRAKRSRWNLCGRMNKRTKAIVFGVSILLVIGIALAVAIPISIKVGSGVYAGASQPDKPITGPGS